MLIVFPLGMLATAFTFDVVSMAATGSGLAYSLLRKTRSTYRT